MKILLVIPVPDFPVGFAYIAAALKQAGHRVAGLNPNNDTRFNSAGGNLKTN